MRRRGVSDLSGALELARVRNCTLKEDSVYGVLGLLPYGEKVNVYYPASLKDATRELFNIALEHGDTSGLYFTRKSYGMIPDIECSIPSMVPKYTFPLERVASGTNMSSSMLGSLKR